MAIRIICVVVLMSQIVYASEKTCFGSVDKTLQALKDLESQVLCANAKSLEQCAEFLGVGSVGVAIGGRLGAGAAKQMDFLRCGKTSAKKESNKNLFPKWFLQQITLNSAHAKPPTVCRLPTENIRTRTVAKGYADDAVKVMDRDIELLKVNEDKIQKEIAAFDKYSTPERVNAIANQKFVNEIEKQIDVISGSKADSSKQASARKVRISKAIADYHKAYERYLLAASKESQEAMEKALQKIFVNIHPDKRELAQTIFRKEQEKSKLISDSKEKRAKSRVPQLKERLSSLRRDLKRIRGERAIFQEASRDLARLAGSKVNITKAQSQAIASLRVYRPKFPVEGELKTRFEHSRILIEHELSKLDAQKEIHRLRNMSNLTVQESLKAQKATTTRHNLHQFRGGVRTITSNFGKRALLGSVSLVALGPGLVLADGGLGCYDGSESQYASFDKDCQEIEEVTDKTIKFLSEPLGIQVQELVEYNRFCESLKLKQKKIGSTRWSLQCVGDGFVLTQRGKSDHKVIAGIYNGDFKVKESAMGGKTWRSSVLYEKNHWKSEDGMLLSTIREAQACCNASEEYLDSKCEAYKATQTRGFKQNNQGGK